MHSFHPEVAHEITDAKVLLGALGSLNKTALLRTEQAGVEVGKYRMKCGRIAAATKNPLQKLFDDDILTKEEFNAGKEYQKNYSISNQDGYAKPRGIWEGLCLSSSTIFKENITNQNRLDARAYLSKRREVIAEADEPRIFRNFKDFKSLKTHHRNTTRSRNLLKILQYIFENQYKVFTVEGLLKADRRTIHNRIKIICEILVDINSRKNYDKTPECINCIQA